MAQFSAAITACNHDSKFKQAYTEGVRKNVYWEVGTHSIQLSFSYETQLLCQIFVTIVLSKDIIILYAFIIYNSSF